MFRILTGISQMSTGVLADRVFNRSIFDDGEFVKKKSDPNIPEYRQRKN